MFKTLYETSIHFYTIAVSVAAFFNPKARLWKKGRQGVFQKISQQLASDTKRKIWFHTASLGEFEQARPVLENIKNNYPDTSVILTFFSPSGYEVRKNYQHADYVFYLPADTSKNAKHFLDIVNPSLAFFTKYDFWYNYLRELHNRNVPVVAISCLFRHNQIYFKKLATPYKKVLQQVEALFLQNQESAEVLVQNDFSNFEVTGDTRYDRVSQNAAQATKLPTIEKFRQNKPLLLAGSSWSEDMEVLIPFINNFKHELKLIIAPHEIKQAEINGYISRINKKSIKFSEIQNQEPTEADILFIDNIGMLSSLYQYADYAFIGGAFGKGLHNILEAAVFGMPLFFGPRYQRFPEAVDLKKQGLAFPVNSLEEFEPIFNDLYTNNNKRVQIAEGTKAFIKQHTGSTQRIMDYCKKYFEGI
ncbi:glycosyltransferase N-terminal domain-containing protein [Cytophagaceae bacterium ABcell3]|nr:glycosyltransferase N-terminal domain-containing protein [Cytophagaceae bacterium ABcell3]